MSHFFIEYGLFLLKAVTIVAAIVVVVGVVASAGRKAAQEGLEIESINKKYKSLATALRQAILNKNEQKKDAKETKKRENHVHAASSWTSRATSRQVLYLHCVRKSARSSRLRQRMMKSSFGSKTMAVLSTSMASQPLS